jgi:membrane protein involved in colicin uptake
MAKQQNTPAAKPADSDVTKPAEQPKATEQKSEPTEAEKKAQAEAAKTAEADAAAQSTADSNAEKAIQPAIEGVEEQLEVKARVRNTLGGVGDTPRPQMVNGRSVVGKVYDEESEEWVDDPDAAATAGVRASDIFDRIGDAFPHEAQRRVVEEIARAAGMGEETTDLPDGMPSLKSTASLRTDASGHGLYTGGGPGVKPVAPGKDGKAQV